MNAANPIDVDSLLASLDPALADSGENQWGSANLESCGECPSCAPDPLYEAANLLFRHRHNLAPDVLRTLASVWQCGSASRYGEPHEEFWADQDDFYAGHDVDECEAENQAGAA